MAENKELNEVFDEADERDLRSRTFDKGRIPESRRITSLATLNRVANALVIPGD